MIVNHYRNISLGNIMLACDIVIIASAFFLPLPESMLAEGGNPVYLQIKRVLYGVAMTISYTVAVDWLMARLHRSVHFLIYSSKYDEIATAINTTVNRGVTVLDGTGWYSKKPVKVISVLVRKPESSLVFSLIHEIDPNALVSIADVGGVFGSGRIGITRYQNVIAATPTIVRMQNRQPTVRPAIKSSMALNTKVVSQTGTAPPYSGKSEGKSPPVT